MVLQHLGFRHFRNLSAVELAWDERFNVIWGRNAQGKTNLLEGIYLLSHLKSFRQARGAELIETGFSAGQVFAEVHDRGVNNRLDLRLHPQGRTPRINQKPITRLSEFFGYLRTVLFTPEELALIRGYPAGRRALLDRAILQVDTSHLALVQEYERLLKQRNQLLKQQCRETELEPWTLAISRTGGRLRSRRLQFIEDFRCHLRRVYQQITADDEAIDLRYSVPCQPEENLAADLRTELEQGRSRELRLGQTLAGPHRDDIEMLVGEESLRSYGSQGQQRSFLLAFKAAQVMDQEKRFGTPPLLLLDDLASELDTSRQAGFVEFLLGQKGQIFLTTAHPAVLAEALAKRACYYRVDSGQVATVTPF